MRYIISITDSISPTSMPFNEFVLFRKENYKNEKQIMIVLFETTTNEKVTYPKDLEIFRIGKNIKKLNKVIKDIAAQAKVENAELIFHIHEGKSVIFFNVATRFKYIERIVYTLHSTYINYSLHNKIFAWISTFMCKYVVCVSKTSFKYFPKDLKKIFNNRIKYIQNGVDTERVNKVFFKNKLEKRNRIFTLIYVARLVSLKRHEILFKALTKLEDIQLFLVGNGPEESNLKEMIKQYDIFSKVKFLGVLSREDVYKTLMNCDCYVSSSSYEGLPISVLEAMYCGKPCIVSKIEQHCEVAEECESLITVEDNIERWELELLKMKNLSLDNLKKIGLNNRRDVGRKFSLKRMHENYSELYETFL